MAYTYEHYINSDEGGKNIILRDMFRRLEEVERQLKGNVPESLEVLERKVVRPVRMLNLGD